MIGEARKDRNEARIAAWCQLAADGDADALGRLLLVYHPRLMSFAERKIGVDWRDRIEAPDLLQDAFYDVARQIESFRYAGLDSFYHWASCIVNSKFIDAVRYWRREKRDVTRVCRLDAGGSRYDRIIDNVMCATATPSRALRRAEATAAIQCCLTQLPGPYRTVVSRLYLDGAPIAAVADELGKSEDAVRRMAGRAVEKLSGCVGRASRYLSGI